jgi:hypothetical protein
MTPAPHWDSVSRRADRPIAQCLLKTPRVHFLVQLKIPSAREYREFFRCIYKITRECGSSPRLIERKRACEDKETFRGFFLPQARSGNEKRRLVT